jgi:hypothetical protein
MRVLDPLKHFGLYVGGIFGAFVHYIAFICEKRVGDISILISDYLAF